MKTYRVRVALLGEQLLSQREMEMNDSLLTLERTSPQRLFPTLPRRPLEMRLQVDVSGNSLSAVSAVFTVTVTLAPRWQHPCQFLFPVKVPTPDKRME